MSTTLAPRMTAPRIILPIEHIDGEDVEDHDHTGIGISECINCSSVYMPGMPILFARTRDGLIWWHRHHCTTYEL
jgi:hypothetical protein